MRLNLAVLLFVPLTSSMLSANGNAAESLEQVKGESTLQKDVNPPVDQHAVVSQLRGVPLESTTVEVQQDAFSETRVYTVWASDVHNEAQVNETRIWLKGLVKDKDRMRDELGWNWDTVEDLPKEEFDRLYDEGRLEEELDNFEVVRAWSGVVLDQAGYEKVAAKTEWVKAIKANLHTSDMNARALPTKIYTVYAADIRNEAQVNETRVWLEGLTKDRSKMREDKRFPWDEPGDIPEDELDRLYDEGRLDAELDNYEVVYAWGGVVLDQSGYDEVVAKTEWVEHVEDPSQYHEVEMIAVPRTSMKTTRTLEARKFEWGDWQKQEGAARDLVQASCYELTHRSKGKQFGRFDYIHEKRAGKGAHVYVLDHGVQVDVKKEIGDKVFPGFDNEQDNSGIVETRAFTNQNAAHNIRYDHSPKGHGTKVASKIVGQWGTAKGATLVPVQVKPGGDDIDSGFERIVADVIRRRRKIPGFKAIVVMSRGTERAVGDNGHKGYTRAEAENDYRAKQQIRWIKDLFNYGVPVVLASGNNAETGSRKIIDHFPQVLETDDFPILNVGAATLAGKAAPFSQGLGTQQDPEKRTQLTIYGVGVDVDVHDQYDGAATQDSGTSFAAPAVAGIIATHMNYESWDQSKQGLDRVKEIKRWITTPESSWERAKDPDKQVNMIWNGADKAAHDSVSNNQSPSPSSQPQKRTFAVGLEQTTTPECSNTISNGDFPPFTTCKSKHENRYFFYRLDNNEEPDSLCISLLNDFHQDDQGATTDEYLFEHPTWPAGEWTLNLFGEEFVYRNDGQSPGALFKGEQQIGCSGDLENHDPLSNELCENTLTKEEGRKRKRRRLIGCTW
ncbi:peptidase S8/S53 domain-containing protein [Alternaria rosae]|uniref:peptidase S8/S53 domain-containing protein n=1 Tax=Alternaria rosae TaxID=1187941 RepID=UPI001E8DB018|nr:peptidase S8/S53 domain-containing protein [Alternaria rosae]KAH6866620.1 peptidase S8/S53 domain-containing protein [Alternaria rosae]